MVLRKQRWPYGAHLIFALHYVAFMYLLTIAAGVSRTIGLSVDVAVAAGYAVILPYLGLDGFEITSRQDTAQIQIWIRAL